MKKKDWGGTKGGVGKSVKKYLNKNPNIVKRSKRTRTKKLE